MFQAACINISVDRVSYEVKLMFCFYVMFSKACTIVVSPIGLHYGYEESARWFKAISVGICYTTWPKVCGHPSIICDC